MKKHIYRSLFTLVFALCATGAGAQMKTSYFMEGSIPRYDMNAALTPMHGYVNMPLIPLGALGFNLNNNFLSIDNFIYPHNGGHVTFLHGSVDPKKFLRRMPSQASINSDITWNLVGFGKYNKNHDYFWSFGWNIRMITDIGIPKELFRILKDLKNGIYDIPDVTVSAMAYTEFVLGFAMPVGWENLVVGGRLKFIMGGAQAEASLNNLNLTVTPDRVSASFGGTMRGNIFGMDYRNMQANEDGTMNPDDLTDWDNRFKVGNGFKSYGAAIDVGAEMKLFDNRLKVSLALNDLGFICWGKSNALQADIDDVEFVYNGYDGNKKDWDIEQPEGNIIKLRKTGNAGYTKRLSTTMNIGAEYNFLDNLLGVGLLSHTKFSNRVNYTELTVAGTVRPADWFTASISHSLINNKIGIFGFALNFHPKGINFFLGVDYIPTKMATIDNVMMPLRAKSMNFYVGLAFTPGAKARSKPWQ